MKKHVYLAFGILALAGIVLFSTNGCGARGQVAVDNVVDAVDKMLGELKIKRKEISNKMAALEKGVKDLKETRIGLQVKREALQKKLDDQNLEKESADKSLRKVSDLLKKAESESADVVKTESGKELKKPELEKYAKELIDERKEITASLDNFQKAADTLDRVIKSLDAKETEYGKKLKEFQQTIELIDNKQVAVQAMKDASQKIDGNDNMKSSIAALEKEIEELGISVETGLRLEDDKWAQSDEAAELEKIKSIIDAEGEGNKLINEIDALLK